MITQRTFCLLFSIVLVSASALAQPGKWQQRVKYTMNIDVDVTTNKFTGKQQLEYTNNSPDTLDKVFFHLYLNAFQPGSMMDTRSRELGKISIGGRLDWDGRVKDRILNLKPEEVGYQHINALKMDGIVQKYRIYETIMEVQLSKAILPKSSVVFDIDYDAQVPLQVRRTGRDNPTSKVQYSMSQWYPKLCEYDNEGWHPTPYVAREFYGVWGDYDVKITIDKNYILGGTGYLQNANQIGYGYETPGTKVVRPAGKKLTWIFSAPNVHDFMWAADKEYKHVTKVVRPDLTLHLLYKATNATEAEWLNILTQAEKAIPYMEKTFGAYPWKQYSFIHGGDGGMEYPMSTLLVGPGAWLHEWLHSWYQGMMATNESLFAWMDEGFTQYAEERVAAFLSNKKGFVQQDNYDNYFYLVQSKLEEPLTTHADHFNSNFAYSIAAYSKGAVFMEQLGYVTGDSIRDRILLEYYKQWRFKHPKVNDFIQIAQKVSGLQLDWYREYFVSTTKTVDYGIDSIWEEGGKTRIRIKNNGRIPMPIDLQLTFKDGSKELHYIPAYLMFGKKPSESALIPRITYEPWRWTHPDYTIESSRKLADVTGVEIDPSQRMADINREDNKIEVKP
ncbi:MAG: M1 family metallopeptidase [Chitinophagaceae bacterium]|nr:M1 family metallopeptidase [Chitinophagaceae bacterium]